jgi:hypothetical protein
MIATAWQSAVAKVRRVFRLIVLFCVLRLAVGVAMIAIFDRDAIAWGPELTVIVVAALVIYVLVALAVRRWARPRAIS